METKIKTKAKKATANKQVSKPKRMIFETRERKKTIKRYLDTINPFEFKMLNLNLNMATNARNLISEFQLSKEEFCKNIRINSRNYNKVINGSYEYDMRYMACFEVYYMDLCKARDEARVKKEMRNKFVRIRDEQDEIDTKVKDDN